MIFRHLAGFLRKHGRISNGAQEKSSTTNLHETRRRGPGRPPGLVNVESRLILTLDPNKFAEKKQRPLHIGDLHRFRPFIARHEQSSLVLGPPLHYDKSDKPGVRMSSYPPDTKAFLYYFTSPEKPPLAGELRLRVASSDDPASFESGSDLLGPNDRLWSRPLYFLSKYYTPLYEKLREERLVPDNLDAALSNPFKSQRRSMLLYTLNDTFIVDFSKFQLYFSVITEQGLESQPIYGAFTDCRGGHLRFPYTGSALARFERSTLPEHEGTRTIVLRFLKIITPVNCVLPNYDDYIRPPEEGELHRRSPKNVHVIWDQAWSVNIDKPPTQKCTTRGLQLLWDT